MDIFFSSPTTAAMRRPEPLEGLLTSLEGMGFRIDQAEDPKSARLAFFQSGGHQILLLAPDVPPGIARQVLESLRQLDPDLPIGSPEHTGHGLRQSDALGREVEEVRRRRSGDRRAALLFGVAAAPERRRLLP